VQNCKRHWLGIVLERILAGEANIEEMKPPLEQTPPVFVPHSGRKRQELKSQKVHSVRVDHVLINFDGRTMRRQEVYPRVRSNRMLLPTSWICQGHGSLDTAVDKEVKLNGKDSSRRNAHGAFPGRAARSLAPTPTGCARSV
jgi:hypothetical protein